MSDQFGWTAQGLEAVVGNMADVVNRIKLLSTEHSVDKIVVGYPLNMDGSAGKRAHITDDFISALENELTCPIIQWDERLTSVRAGKIMRETGVNASKNKTKVDILSAVILLQSYLDSAQ